MARRRNDVVSSDRLLVVVPAYGHHAMTHDLVGDLTRERDLADVVVVDNAGDYSAVNAEKVVRPASNLGWAGGTNLGTVEGRRPEHVGFVWLNNDTRLSIGFLRGLLSCWRATGAGLVGPLYDCHWSHQRPRRTPPVDQYRPRSTHFKAAFVDGTCMYVPASTIDAIGVLDAETFAPVGWGAEIDYGLRVGAARLQVCVTALSYLHHEKSVTGKTAFEGGLDEYATLGFPVAMDGLQTKWGDDWQRRAGIDPTTGQTPSRSWRTRLRRRLTRSRA
jgi:GT2 family glycosyltransferase